MPPFEHEAIGAELTIATAIALLVWVAVLVSLAELPHDATQKAINNPTINLKHIRHLLLY
jgi:hypothetical protein